ncbi:hypothetical protein CEXT_623871 [Caerostris extrusa]|uniref:Uncharacterized protein n=1 Tax=Caerostris extrusa TaxID=172846 RepID=A0AAV4MF88_CAEEX|nr:hypothetical protein CEXT_623871 [Caerostris extrusa]
MWVVRDKRVARQKESDNVRSSEKCLLCDLLFHLESSSFLLREIGRTRIDDHRYRLKVDATYSLVTCYYLFFFFFLGD